MNSSPRNSILDLLNTSFPTFLGAFGLMSLLALSGCSDPQEKAVTSLEDLRYGFSVDDYLLAAEAGDLAAMELFREAGMEIDVADASGNTALMRAAAGGRLELVESLLDAGADPRARNQVGRTPLMFSAESGRTDVLRKLLSRGSELRDRDKEGWTALKLAAFKGRPEAVELLAGKGDQETLDQALLVACFKGDTAVIDQLLNHGAYINARSPENLTPLMIAAQAGHEDAVKFLLQNQANPYALDELEQTAANLAEKSGHENLRDLLLDPTSILEVAESGHDIDSLLVENNPLIAEAAISDALLAINGGESPQAEAVGLTERAPDEVLVEESMPTRKQDDRRLASINGRTIGAASEKTDVAEPGVPENPANVISDAVDSLRMKNYREEPLPVMLKGVASEGGIAQVRVLSSRGNEPVPVKAGDLIPGTNLKVASMDAKFISSKMGKGELVDVSSILVEDTDSGAKHLLVKDVPGRSTETYATLVLPGSPFEYVVKNGDVFRAVTAGDGEQDYEVLDVRPTQVVIRNVATEEVVTVNRDGIAMR
jgi:ankyrin repeat protein